MLDEGDCDTSEAFSNETWKLLEVNETAQAPMNREKIGSGRRAFELLVLMLVGGRAYLTVRMYVRSTEYS